ncbi:MAG: MCE family protein [Acidobacteria bacterium]|nr:MAG: MCE family protein [Acidobacteriota bacterium]REK00898.1 MAG: MCE family protein [Acidobacteriota bacterium]
MRSAPRSPILALLVLLVPAAAALLSGCGNGDDALEFAVTFDDAGGIGDGDEVVYKGLDIGEVTGVGVDQQGNVRVDVRVRSDYRGAIATNSLIEIERAGLLGGRQLTVRDGEGERRPLEDRGVLAGTLGPVSSAVSSLRSMSTQALTALRETANDLEGRLRGEGEGEGEGEGAEGEPSEPSVASQLAELTAAFESLRQQAETDGIEADDPRLRAEVEKVRERLDALRARLAEEGTGLRERLTPLLEDLERWLRNESNQGEGP